MNSSGHLQPILQHSTLVYYVVLDATYVCRYVNNLFQKSFSHLFNGQADRHFANVVSTGDATQWQQLLKECCCSGKVCRLETVVPDAAGNSLWTCWEFMVQHDEAGQVEIHGTGTDITGQKKESMERQRLEEELHLFLENTEESFLIVNDALDIIAYNRESANRIKKFMNIEMQKGINLMQLITPGRQAVITDACWQAFDGIPVKTEVVYTHKDQELIFVSRFRPAFNKEGKITAVIINSHDDTQRYKTEQMIRNSEERFRALVENSSDAIVVLNKDLLVEDISAAFTRILGYEREEIIGQNRWSNVHPLQVDDLIARLQYLTAHPGYIINTEVQVLNKQGIYHWLSITIQNMLHVNAIRGIVVNMRDITERKTAEEALRISEERWKFALEGSNQGVWDWDVETGKVFFSARWKKMLGYEEQEQFQTLDEWRSRIHPEDVDQVNLDIATHLNAKEPYYENTYRLRAKDGSYKWIMGRGFIVSKTADGKPLRMIGTHTDITDRVRSQEQLRKSNERFEYAAKASSDALWEWDIVKDSVYISKAYTKMLGWEVRPDRKYREWHNLIHPDDKETTLQSFYNTLEDKNRNAWEKEYRYLKADGSFAFVVDRAFIIRNKTGAPVKMVGAISDISKWKMAELELRKSNERFKLAGQATSDAIWDWNLATNTLTWGEGYETLFGYKIAEAGDDISSWKNYIHPDDKVSMLQEYERVLWHTTNTFWKAQYRFIRADGSIAYVLDKGMIIRDEKGRAYRMVGAMQDITQQKETEARLSHEKNLLRTLIDHLPDLIYVKDAGLRHLISNKAGVDFIGATSEADILGKTAAEYAGASFANSFLHDDDHIIKEGVPIVNIEEPVIDKEGGRRWFLTTKVPLCNEEGQPVGLVGISRDITEHRRLEATLAEEKLAGQRKITEATIQAQERERTDIGKELHDNINQILTTTKLYIDMALSDKEVQDELLNKCHNNVSKAIEEIRRLSKALVPPSLGDIGLKEAVAEMISQIVITSKIKIHLTTSGLRKAVIPADLQLMVYRIVQEQVNNIIKHSKASRAEIKLIISRKMFNIMITDDGVGFDYKKKARGIGLSNISSRAALHKGRVEIISAPGSGCTLNVFIPL